ncbi:DMT family transporter [Sphingomonas sp.]|uniref:DMT family transporter n=1 Tax=Sphingomonas sp. TaxID=28214 RepID=UPI003AFF6FD3
MSGAVASVLFVLVWSTGFVVARAAIAHADPQAFLLARMAATALLLGLGAAALRERRLPATRAAMHVGLGAAMPGFYLCASWWSVGTGMPAGVMSLLGALQPLPIALIAFLGFGERLSTRSVAGMAVGVAGVTMVLAPTLERGGATLAVLPAVFGLAAVLAMAAATLVQHRLLAGDPLLGTVALQNVGGAVTGVLGCLVVGSTRWDGGAWLWASFAWSVLGLSIGGLVLFAWLIGRQGATRVSTLLLLVPALAAVEAWALFGETLAPFQIVGFVLALGGVLLARRAADRTPEPAAEPA